MTAVSKKKSNAAPSTPAEKSARARAARNKGQRGELKVVHKLRELWPETTRLFQDRGGESDGPDVEVPMSGGGLDIEVKHRDVSAIRPAIRDAQANRRPGNTWAAVDWPTDSGKNGGPTITLNLDEFVDLIRRDREAAQAQGFAAGVAHARAGGSP